MIANSSRRLASEFLGTAGLLMAVVGSGIMGERLAGGNPALVLLANSLATGAALVALILTFGAISGGHFNPAVTLSVALQKSFSWRAVSLYVVSQIAGAFAGVIATHTMFGLPVLSASRHVDRSVTPSRGSGPRMFPDFCLAKSQEQWSQYRSLAGCSLRNQCKKWRMPVKTMAMPRRSAAAMTSLSRTDPPG